MFTTNGSLLIGSLGSHSLLSSLGVRAEPGWAVLQLFLLANSVFSSVFTLNSLITTERLFRAGDWTGVMMEVVGWEVLFSKVKTKY